jgi:hypothetical protein
MLWCSYTCSDINCDYCVYLQTTVTAVNKNSSSATNDISPDRRSTLILSVTWHTLLPHYNSHGHIYFIPRIQSDHHTSHHWFSRWATPYLLLMPDAHLTHQHEEERAPPPQQHTCSRHLVQRGMTTRPQQQTIVTPSHHRTVTPQGPAS